MADVQKLDTHHWHELYCLMRQQAFPDVPDTFETAQQFFKEADLYGLIDKTGLKAGFIFGQNNGICAFIDVICAPTARGKWAGSKTLRYLYDIAFREMKLKYIWTQPFNQTALKAATQAGFSISVAAQSPDDAPVMVLTPHQLQKRFLTQLEDN